MAKTSLLERLFPTFWHELGAPYLSSHRTRCPGLSSPIHFLWQDNLLKCSLFCSLPSSSWYPNPLIFLASGNLCGVEHKSCLKSDGAS